MTTRITPGVGANLLGQHAAERNQDATAYVGNLDSQVSEELLWELFVQAGPVVNVYVPKDRVTNLHQGYGFVEFRSEEDADYAIKILNMIKLYGKPIRVNKASQDKKSLDVGANLFVGNLDPDVDEKLLYDTFSAFGVIVTNPKIMRDPDSGNSRGFGFISYDSFEASDSAIEAMNGQYLCNRAITVSYAYKKDTKGERHGTMAERMLASNNPNATKNRPHTLFASGPPSLVGPPQLGQGLPPAPAQANGSMGMGMNGSMHPPAPFNGGPPPMPPPPQQGQMMQGLPPPPPQGYGGPMQQQQHHQNQGPPQQMQGGQGGPPQWGNQGPPMGMPPPQFRGGPPGSRPPNMPPPPHGFHGGPPGGGPPPMGMGGPPPWGRGPPPQGMRPPPPGMQQQQQQQQQGMGMNQQQMQQGMPPPPRGPPGMPPPPGGMMGGPGGRPPPPPENQGR
ncbi:hypothetical protein KC19_1G279200 [Ceratodon purpureus]|uniref:Splicing factor 3B subunit 4 n=1 Tax=Ceratodon purpureus TaxID=3225 RepID=A0A8T0JA29_CERPU|nr:hypothetical protein KC19_1G279200 [Ceratodon purpureus]